jgi:DsbC/DsbD-like thiol-disulfide interchange protein
MRIVAFGAPLLAAALFAQAPRGSAPDPASIHDTKHVQVITSATQLPGGRVSLVAAVRPKPRMHVYAPGQTGLIGVALTVDSRAGFTAAAPKYPRPEKRVVAGDTELVYSQPFQITDDLTLPHGASAPITIKGSLRYQACDDVICYLPTTVPLEWKISK